MTTLQMITALAAAIVAFGGGGAGLNWMRGRSPSDTGAPETTDVLLGRIGALETELVAERLRSTELETQVTKLREERRELAARVSHLEGQTATLMALVQGLLPQR
jgi:hypothetical protein